MNPAAGSTRTPRFAVWSPARVAFLASVVCAPCACSSGSGAADEPETDVEDVADTAADAGSGDAATDGDGAEDGSGDDVPGDTPPPDVRDDSADGADASGDDAGSADGTDSDAGDAGHDPGAPPSSCPAHQASCGGVCRAIEVDPDACGGCDTRCDSGEVCEQGVCAAPAPPALACDDAKVAEVLAEATSDAPFVVLDCSLTLPADSVVTKAIRLTGSDASGVVLDCQGSTIVRGVPEGGADLVLIESRRVDDAWERPTDVTIRDCRIEGSVRIRGQGNNGQAPDVTTDSWTPGHRERAQAAAPTRVLLERITIVGDGRIPLYLAPGATQVRLRDSEIVGESVSTLMYLDAESAYNRIVGNRFAGTPLGLLPREEVAVDGSADNLIAGNLFDGVSNGGIYIYRNCGEGGAVRHQEPRRNVVAGNVFVLEGRAWENPWLWVGSRNEGGVHRATYCDLDDAYDFGSGASDDDFARDTVVVGNRVVDSPLHPAVSGAWGLAIGDTPTYVDDDREVDAPVEPLGPVCVVFGDEAPPVVLSEGATSDDGRTCSAGVLQRPAP